MNSIVITSFIAFAIIVGIPIVFENVIEQVEEAAEQRQDQSPTLDDDNHGMIISEEICPPNCSPPPPIQELPQEQLP
ncbi:MAG: hypothetical protein K0S67_1998 [Nitrososphaeraceae archaeon]|jgi:hypothetical protein|nr:hypothetical protein [Nitrososphaeraceae archaeon]